MKTPKHQQRDWLYEQYAVRKLSADRIGKISGCCGPIILKWLRRFNISIRTTSDPYFRSTLNPVFKKYKDVNWLSQKYYNEGLSCKRMAELISKETSRKIGQEAINKWMERFGMVRNNRIEMKYTKDNHFNWKGGRYLKHGYWYVNIDGIQHCEHRYLVEKFIGRKLKRNEIVHHINGDKKDNRLDNFYLFVGEQSHQEYHHRLQMAILKNLNIKTGVINLKSLGVEFITKSNLSCFKE